MKTILSILLLILTTGQMALASEQVVFYHTDPVGTPLAITNSTGAVVWQADYKPFGEENTVTSSAANEWRFVGKEKDTETGFSYFGARYQNAVTGRFIAVDPAGAVDEKTSRTNEKMLLDPQRLNFYAYGLNNPYRYFDPNGKAPLLTAEDPMNQPRFNGGGFGNASEEVASRPMMGEVGSASVSTAEELSAAAGRAASSIVPGKELYTELESIQRLRKRLKALEEVI